MDDHLNRGGDLVTHVMGVSWTMIWLKSKSRCKAKLRPLHIRDRRRCARADSRTCPPLHQANIGRRRLPSGYSSAGGHTSGAAIGRVVPKTESSALPPFFNIILIAFPVPASLLTPRRWQSFFFGRVEGKE
jgi:hypothetical protein